METGQKNLDTIFCEAVEIESAEEREAYLEMVCGDNVALRHDAARLIADHFEAGDFLETPAVVPYATLDQAITEKPGGQIGPYKLLQLIGEGGMGVVYMAEQTEPVKRRVALKIIKPGMDTRQVIARFEAERQALAMMDHPNIAKVLDAGATDSGRPYFVMELVNGVPVTGYCDEQHLTPSERLELFLPICQAVQHAHQKGIIHRDLKPSNILVALYDGQAVPKIIDFGVAKATSQTLTEKTMFTQFGQVVGTVEYMSPEQAERNQLDIDTRSDVYSLGVVLYELLTGETPFDRERLRSAAFEEMLRIIREEEPSKPSTKVNSSPSLRSIAANRCIPPVKLGRMIRGELDWIVMTAMEKDRTRRYESAIALASDIQRYTSDQLVEARPPSMKYRIEKFVRRNRSILFAFFVFAVAFVVVVGSLGWTIRDRTARRQAVRRDLALAVSNARSYQAQGKWAEALAAIRQAESLLARGHADKGSHQLVGQLRAEMRQHQADQRMIDRLTQAAMLESQLWVEQSRFMPELALPEYKAAFGDYGFDPSSTTAEHAASFIRRRTPQTQLVLIAALDRWSNLESRFRQDSDERERNVDWIESVIRASDDDLWRAQMREAVSKKDYETLRNLANSDDLLSQAPYTLRHLSEALFARTDDREIAIKVLRRAQQAYANDFWINCILASQLRQVEPPNLVEAARFYSVAVSLQPENAGVRLNLGSQLAQLGHLEEAMAAYKKAIELQPDYAVAHNNLGALLCDHMQRYEEAQSEFHEAIDLDPSYASPHYNLGKVHTALGNLDEAVAAYRESIKLQPNFAPAHNALGALLCDHMQRYEEAESEFCQAIDLDPNYAMAYFNLGNVRTTLGNLDEAVAAYRESIRLDSSFPSGFFGLGTALRRQGKTGPAIEAYQRAIALSLKDVMLHQNLAHALADSGRFDEAIAQCKVAIRLTPNHVSYGTLAYVLGRSGDLDGAIEAGRRTVELKPDYRIGWHNLGRDYLWNGDLDAALAACREAVRLGAENALSHHNLGEVLFLMGRFDESIAANRQALRLKASDSMKAKATIAIARCLLRKKLIDEAIDEYQLAIGLPGTFQADAYSGLAMAYLRKGDYNAAITSLQKSLQLRKVNSPNRSLDLMLLAIVEHEMGNAQAAHDHYEQGLNWMQEHPIRDQVGAKEVERLRAEAESSLGSDSGKAGRPLE